MNTELLKLGFVTLRLVDLIDIVLVATVFYYLWKLTRNTRAARMWIGILLLLAFGMVARVLNLRALSWILASLSAIWAVAFIILFQPELRRALSELGGTPWSRRRIPQEVPDIILKACAELAQRRWGAIILLREKNTLEHYLDTGNPLHADLSHELLVNIFAPGAPLHDGAVLVDGVTILAARCVLPVADESDEPLGMRHRAALAATQDTDAIAVVVSEETGKISLAANGNWLIFRSDADTIAPQLKQLLGIKER